MLTEHQQALCTLQISRLAALNEHHPMVTRFADMITMHTKTEKEVLYPAAALVSKYFKMKLKKELKTQKLFYKTNDYSWYYNSNIS